MTTTDKILKAKARLILHNPFFAILALRMEYIPAEVETCETNGKRIEYNPAYVDSLDIDHLTATLAHLVLHIVMFHHTRRGDRDIELWNQAADYAINPILKGAGFELPEGALLKDEYNDLTAEQIFSMLPVPPPPNNPQPSPGTGQGMGGVKDAAEKDKAEKVEAEVRVAMTQAASLADRMGKMPAGLQRYINEELQPKIDWREVLARFITELTKNDYTWTSPSPRFLHLGLYLPSLRSPELGRLVLFVDTSGSIDEEMINQFAGEVQEITYIYNIDITVIYIDDEVSSVQEIERGDKIKLTPTGGGGTDFRPGFAHVGDHDLRPVAVIYLTDGRCHNFPESPDYPVLWALFGYKREFNPPFGEAIYVD